MLQTIKFKIQFRLWLSVSSSSVSYGLMVSIQMSFSVNVLSALMRTHFLSLVAKHLCHKALSVHSTWNPCIHRVKTVRLCFGCISWAAPESAYWAWPAVCCSGGRTFISLFLDDSTFSNTSFMSTQCVLMKLVFEDYTYIYIYVTQIQLRQKSYNWSKARLASGRTLAKLLGNSGNTLATWPVTQGFWSLP